VKMKLLPLDSV